MDQRTWRDDLIARDWPEYDLYPDAAARRAVLAEIQKRYFRRNVRFYAYALAIFVFAALAFPLFKLTLGRLLGWFNLPMVVQAIVYGISIVGIYFLGIGYFWQKTIRRELRRDLQSRGIAVCLNCGYDCRALRAARCPECGVDFDERLLTGAPRKPATVDAAPGESVSET